MNWVNGTAYPRYHFINLSSDIISIYTEALDVLGVHWTQPRWYDISVARRPDVAFIDSFVGPRLDQYNRHPAGVMESGYMMDSKSIGPMAHAGSNPASGTESSWDD